MADHQSRRGVCIAALAGIACFGLAAAGCSSSSSTPASGGSSASASASAKPTGTANVAYASSLQFLNEKIVSPAFTKAEGYKFSGRGGASGDLETDIASGEISPNVFESVGGDNITPLQPKFTKWYVQYAGTSIVVAYNPKSKHASRVQGHRRRQEADLQPVQQRAADAGLQARPHRPEHRPAGPGLHLHARAGPVLLPPAVGHGHEDPRHLRLRHGVLLADLRRVLARRDAAVRPARRVQRLRHPGDRAAPALHQAAGRHQPGQLRGRRGVHQGDDHDQGRQRSRRARRRSSTSPRSARRPRPGWPSSSTRCPAPAWHSTSRAATRC